MCVCVCVRVCVCVCVCVCMCVCVSHDYKLSKRVKKSPQKWDPARN